MLSIGRCLPVLSFVGLLGLSVGAGQLRAGSPNVVSFDAPAIVVAEPLDAGVTSSPTTGGELMRLKIVVSTMVDASYRGGIDEFVVSMDSPSGALRVLDYWPKTELYSEVEGKIAVQNQAQKNQNFSFAVAGGYEPFVRGNASGDYHSQQQVHEAYERRPPMQLLTSSGTVQRGSGVFFKFHPGPSPLLEGDREVAMLVEVPLGWRADLLHMSMQASGTRADGFGSQQSVVLGSTELWTAVHRLGDRQAAESARKYVSVEQSLRRLAVANRESIEHRSLPTVFHKLGAALDVVEPKIPSNFLYDILFNLGVQRFNDATAKLPVDLRVATLDYWDQRSQLLRLAQGPAILQ